MKRYHCATFQRKGRWVTEMVEFVDAPYVTLADHEAEVARLTSWRPMDTAPRDGTDVLLVYLKSLPGTQLNPFKGRAFVGNWQGAHCRWVFASPVGLGGIPDRWLYGWMPLPEFL
jgi:hypothetical protein